MFDTKGACVLGSWKPQKKSDIKVKVIQLLDKEIERLLQQNWLLFDKFNLEKMNLCYLYGSKKDVLAKCTSNVNKINGLTSELAELENAESKRNLMEMRKQSLIDKKEEKESQLHQMEKETGTLQIRRLLAELKIKVNSNKSYSQTIKCALDDEGVVKGMFHLQHLENGIPDSQYKKLSMYMSKVTSVGVESTDKDNVHPEINTENPVFEEMVAMNMPETEQSVELMLIQQPDLSDDKNSLETFKQEPCWCDEFREGQFLYEMNLKKSHHEIMNKGDRILQLESKINSYKEKLSEITKAKKQVQEEIEQFSLLSEQQKKQIQYLLGEVEIVRGHQMKCAFLYSDIEELTHHLNERESEIGIAVMKLFSLRVKVLYLEQEAQVKRDEQLSVNVISNDADLDQLNSSVTNQPKTAKTFSRNMIEIHNKDVKDDKIKGSKLPIQRESERSVRYHRKPINDKKESYPHGSNQDKTKMVANKRPFYRSKRSNTYLRPQQAPFPREQEYNKEGSVVYEKSPRMINGATDTSSSKRAQVGNYRPSRRKYKCKTEKEDEAPPKLSGQRNTTKLEGAMHIEEKNYGKKRGERKPKGRKQFVRPNFI